MNKLFHGVVEIIFWIAIFSSPLLIGAALGFILYMKAPEWEWVSITMACTGGGIGILFAERVRRKYGCTNYMSRLVATDIPPNDPSEKKKK